MCVLGLEPRPCHPRWPRGEVDADRRPRADLDRADAAQLAVALDRVAVAEEQQAARHRDGQQQRAAGAELLHVHVAAVRPVVDGADRRPAAARCRSCRPSAARGSRARRPSAPRRRARRPRARARRSRGAGSSPTNGPKPGTSAVNPGGSQLQALDAAGQHVLGRRALDVDRAGDRVHEGKAHHRGLEAVVDRVQDVADVELGLDAQVRARRDARDGRVVRPQRVPDLALGDLDDLRDHAGVGVVGAGGSPRPSPNV